MSESVDTLSYDEAKQLLDDLLARAARDPDFRKLCLLDGREALKVSSGRELPEDVTVHFIDHPGAGAGIMLPPLELDAASLHGVSAPAPAAPDVSMTPESSSADEPRPAAAPRGLNIRPRQG
jgi:hypothetical protein